MDSDLDLLDRWSAGDNAAGNALFQRHFDDVFRFFEHKVAGAADELVQETFLACVRRRDEFRRMSSFRTFLFAIARFELYAYFRRRTRRGDEIDFDAISLGELVTTPASRMARETDRARLLAALRSLPLEAQLLLELYYWEDMTSEELAEVFDLAHATARTRLFRARKLLRTCMEESTDAPAHAADGFDRWVSSLRAKRGDLARRVTDEQP